MSGTYRTLNASAATVATPPDAGVMISPVNTELSRSAMSSGMTISVPWITRNSTSTGTLTTGGSFGTTSTTTSAASPSSVPSFAAKVNVSMPVTSRSGVYVTTISPAPMSPDAGSTEPPAGDDTRKYDRASPSISEALSVMSTGTFWNVVADAATPTAGSLTASTSTKKLT